MIQKKLQKTREQAAALVQPGETLRHAVGVTSGPSIAMALGPIGVAFLKFRVVALTDKAVYIMTQTPTGGAKKVEQRMPLGSVAVSTAKHPMPLQSTLVVGDQKWNVGKIVKDDAERLAAAVPPGSGRTDPS